MLDNNEREKLNTNTPITDHIREQLIKICDETANHKNGNVFKDPVDTSRYGDAVTDYYDIIKSPMDLSTLKKNLRENKYPLLWMFLLDAQKIWDNCRTYNGNESSYAVYAKESELHFNGKIRSTASLGLNEKCHDAIILHDFKKMNPESLAPLSSTQLQEMVLMMQEISPADLAEILKTYVYNFGEEGSAVVTEKNDDDTVKQMRIDISQLAPVKIHYLLDSIRSVALKTEEEPGVTKQRKE